ncbi:hypothetical protein EVA_11159 [gut metagenome]|uniref:Uncharacterized protein n=1 Tax=gut metagenome TaxID=749906 RepID=J9CKY9_9ZZZZ
MGVRKKFEEISQTVKDKRNEYIENKENEKEELDK